MYKNNFVCSLKVEGKILRENSGVVALPFGCEYEILLKNLGSRRAMVKVSVDGQDATESTKLILQPNDSVTLERFIKNGNLSAGNRFKFIERTAGIEAHRGVKEDDGLVRAEFWAEKEVVDVPIVRKHYYDEYYPRPWYPPYYPYQWGIWCNSGSNQDYRAQQVMGDSTQAQYGSGILRCANMMSAQNYQTSGTSVNCASMSSSCGSNDSGITVPGSESHQSFSSSFGFPLESNSHVIVLQLRGEAGGLPVATPVTVDQKPICPTHGKKNKPCDRFCGECGTSLVWI